MLHDYLQEAFDYGQNAGAEILNLLWCSRATFVFPQRGICSYCPIKGI